MSVPLLELEGTWEEIAARLPDFAGRRIHIVVSEAKDIDTDPASRKINVDILAILRSVEESNRSLNPKPDPRDYLREGRDGGMFGYEPAE